LIFLRRKTISLGDFRAEQFTLFEHKRLFSVIFYWFHGDGWQGRFHTHAFRALSLRLWGTYRERVMAPNGSVVERERGDRRLLYFPREHAHELGISRGCLTMLVAGPWRETWREHRGGRWTTLGWGRRRLD
jgi:hypothetical protein